MVECSIGDEVERRRSERKRRKKGKVGKVS